MKAYIDCIGCEQRQLDAQRIVDYLKANNVEISQDPKSSDYAILVTCGVDSWNESRSLDRFNRLVANVGSHTRVLVGGCLPKIAPEYFAGKVHGIFSPRNMHSLDAFFADQITIPIERITPANRSSLTNPTQHTDNSPCQAREEYEKAKEGFKIVIGHGCLLSCSYCAIKKATGRLKSESIEEIVSQFTKGVRAKEPTIMLMGGDTGAYGRDIGVRFYDLLKRLTAIPSDSRLFIHDLNINWLINDLEKYEKIFHMGKIRGATFPIQSGSDKILKLMRRPYTTQEAVKAVQAISKADPNLKVGTHLIVGFPTETSEDFNLTEEMLEKANCDFISCFKYSDRKGTQSSLLSPKVDKVETDARANRLLKRFGNKIRIFGD